MSFVRSIGMPCCMMASTRPFSTILNKPIDGLINQLSAMTLAETKTHTDHPSRAMEVSRFDNLNLKSISVLREQIKRELKSLKDSSQSDDESKLLCAWYCNELQKDIETIIEQIKRRTSNEGFNESFQDELLGLNTVSDRETLDEIVSYLYPKEKSKGNSGVVDAPEGVNECAKRESPVDEEEAHRKRNIDRMMMAILTYLVGSVLIGQQVLHDEWLDRDLPLIRPKQTVTGFIVEGTEGLIYRIIGGIVGPVITPVAGVLKVAEMTRERRHHD